MMSVFSIRAVTLGFMLYACVLLQPGPACAADQVRRFDSAAQLVTAVTGRAASVHSLTCSVYQEKHLAMLAQPVVFTGRMSLQRPDRLRWEFTYPIPSTFIIDRTRVIRCTPSTRPVEFDINSSPAMKQAAAQMLAWVSGDFKGLSDMFSMTLASNGTGFVLVPSDRAMAAGIERITVMFDPVTLRPATVRIDEQGGDWTRIILSDYRINPELADRIFEECLSENAF